jgi:hypothetical protein
MPSRVVLLLLVVVTGCGFDVSLGPADGIREVRHVEELAATELKQGALEIGRDLVVITEEQAGRYLDRFGPDRIGAITAVEIALVEVTVTGGQLARPPVIGIAGRTMIRPGDEVSLPEADVDELRARILARREVILPLRLSVEAAEPLPDGRAADLRVEIVLQPILHVNATKTF